MRVDCLLISRRSRARWQNPLLIRPCGKKPSTLGQRPGKQSKKVVPGKEINCTIGLWRCLGLSARQLARGAEKRVTIVAICERTRLAFDLKQPRPNFGSAAFGRLFYFAVPMQLGVRMGRAIGLSYLSCSGWPGVPRCSRSSCGAPQSCRRPRALMGASDQCPGSGAEGHEPDFRNSVSTEHAILRAGKLQPPQRRSESLKDRNAGTIRASSTGSACLADPDADFTPGAFRKLLKEASERKNSRIELRRSGSTAGPARRRGPRCRAPIAREGVLPEHHGCRAVASFAIEDREPSCNHMSVSSRSAQPLYPRCCSIFGLLPARNGLGRDCQVREPTLM